MAKSLSERIADRVRKAAASKTATEKNLAAFLAVRDDVRTALDDGWTVKLVWSTLRDEGKITVSYEAFRGYVNRLIVRPPAAAVGTSAPTGAPTPSMPPSGGTDLARPTPSADQAKSPAIVQPGQQGFQFQATPNKGDLV